ncbi:MAG: VOC family protein [Pseudomonadota bacterium]|nr:VOC family protein [Pseudomonadota bacterium]
MPDNINFRPRRFGHVNLWVSDVEKSIQFYEMVLGIELVRRERRLKIGFHSNGNTHHDIAVMEISRGMDRYDREGNVQVSKTRGTAVSLNHLGWEMTSEHELVEAYKRAKQFGNINFRTADHLVAHSVYVSDPDGNLHEFYADALEDWRTVFNLELEDEVTAEWNPLDVPPSVVHRYPVNAPTRLVRDAPLHPVRINRATLGTRNLNRMVEFLVNVGGFTLQGKGDGVAVFGGSAAGEDLHVIEVPKGEKIGLKAFSFVVDAEIEIFAATERLKKMDIDVTLLESPGGPSLIVTDPDGFRIEIFTLPN